MFYWYVYSSLRAIKGQTEESPSEGQHYLLTGMRRAVKTLLGPCS